MPRYPDKEISRRLLDWYRENKRLLPWRRTKDPYRILVSEVMLQQTRVDTVIPYYERFLKRFPDVKTLARARPDDVLKAWENLGYYSRSRHLHEAARIVVERFGGKIPATMEDLRKLPGVGAYTAGAVLSIAFGKPVAAIDGNVMRVIARLFGIGELVDDGNTAKTIKEIAERLVPAVEPGHYNQALMDLGAGICTPRAPVCPACPLSGVCTSRKSGTQESIPVKKRAVAVPHREAAVSVLHNDIGKILLVKRPNRGLLGGLWRFPGTELTKGRSAASALRNSLREDLGLKVRLGKEIFAVDHGYSHFSVTVHIFPGRIREGLPSLKSDGLFRWVGSKDLPRLPLSRLEMKIMDNLHAQRPAWKLFVNGKTGSKRVK